MVIKEYQDIKKIWQNLKEIIIKTAVKIKNYRTKEHHRKEGMD